MIPAFGLFCNPESRRVEGFCAATAKLLQQFPLEIPWLAVLEQKPWRKDWEVPLRFLRLESPGRNWAVEKQLLLWGTQVQDEEAHLGWRTVSPANLASLQMDHGLITPLRQWFLGWRKVLRELDAWSRQNGMSQNWISQPEHVICMFDKAATQVALETHAFPVPPTLGIPAGFDQLWELMKAAAVRRVFLKPCHGSSASGVVAVESSNRQIQAFTTVEPIYSTNHVRLYNHRRIRTCHGTAAVRDLVDSVCRERCIAQVWVPKAGIQGKPFDLRVVVIGGRARHVMVRLGHGPITNSQLLGGKGETTLLRKRIGEEQWDRILTLCEQALAICFPGTLYAGFDVLIEPNFRTPRIIEVNAFGDLLPRLLHEGRSTYEWEVLSALQRHPILSPTSST